MFAEFRELTMRILCVFKTVMLLFIFIIHTYFLLTSPVIEGIRKGENWDAIGLKVCWF